MRIVRLASVVGMVFGSVMLAACGGATPAPQTGGEVATPAIAAVATSVGGYGATAATTPETSPGGAASAANTVNVTVKDFEVMPAVSTIKAGTVQFVVTNEGPKEEHELVVFKTDTAPEALPTKADGSADEDKVTGKKMGEVEQVPVGQSKSFTLDLEPGKYVLICNVVTTTDGSAESHYAMGMHVPFTVTP